MGDDRQVRFVRIKGRIVPIRGGKKKPKKQQRQIGRGAALAAGGLAISALSGFAGAKVARFIFKRSALPASKLLKTTHFAMAKESRSVASALGQNIVQKGIRRMGITKKGIKIGSDVVGAGLVSTGISKFFTDAEKERMGIGDDMVSHVAGAAAVGVSNIALRKGFGHKLITKQLKFPGL